MSSSGSNSPASASSSGSADQKVEQLIKQLKNLLSELRNTREVPQTVVLEETCSRLRSLEKEVEDLRGRVEQLLATVEKDKADAVRRLLYKA